MLRGALVHEGCPKLSTCPDKFDEEVLFWYTVARFPRMCNQAVIVHINFVTYFFLSDSWNLIHLLE